MPTAIIVGDTVNVSINGQRPRVLPEYEVLQIPGQVQDYWEFEGPTGDIVAARDVVVTKVP